MGNPFVPTSVSSYNANPPPDDGSQVASNIVAWSTIKTKLPDPIKSAFDTSETATNTAFSKVVGGGGITTTAVDYQVLAADQGKFVKVTASGKNITTPDATVVGSPFVFYLVNESTGNITFTGANPGVQQTIDGSTVLTLPAGTGCVANTDGTNWFTGGQNFVNSTIAPVPGGYKNLSVKVATTTTVAVAADFVVTTDGTHFLTTAVSATIDLGSNGAVNKLDAGTIAIDTWYAIWVIAKSDGTTGALASTSFTSPTLPSGYTYKARVGAVQTVHATATLYGSYQFGRQAQYVIGVGSTTKTPVIANGVKGTFSTTSPTLVTATVTGNGFFVPTTASKIYLAVANNYSGSAAANILVAPNTSWGGTNNGPAGSNGMVWPCYVNAGPPVQHVSTAMVLETTTIAVAGDANGFAVACLGWEDNI